MRPGDGSSLLPTSNLFLETLPFPTFRLVRFQTTFFHSDFPENLLLRVLLPFPSGVLFSSLIVCEFPPLPYSGRYCFSSSFGFVFPNRVQF